MKSARILVIDDNRIIFELIRHVLLLRQQEDQEAYEVAFATDGVEGLHQCDRFRPDVIILDIHLPKMNGGEVLKTLRSRGNRTPVIVLTAGGRRADMNAFFLEHDMWMEKPFQPLLLYRQVRKHLSGKAHRSSCIHHSPLPEIV